MKTIINNSIFTELVKFAVCQTGDDLEVIGYESTYKGFHLSFYKDENENLILEELLKISSMQEFVVNKSQSKMLQEVIDNKIQQVELEAREEELSIRSERQHMNWLRATCNYGN